MAVPWWAALALVLTVGPVRLAAQDSAAAGNATPNAPAVADEGVDPRPNECFGFSFGEWDPPLDWAAARHRVPRAAPDTPVGPRGDASHAGLAADSTLMLYPTWWPAGVLVKFTERNVAGDTLRGTATALVADGRVRAPTARIVGWRVRCR